MNNMDNIEIKVNQDELIMLQTIRKYRVVSEKYIDFKIEIREGKVARILPTFSEIIPPVVKKY
jgi:hypothetical protein